MAKLLAACLALAAVSLLLPSEPSYDPWAWFVWGQELAHLELDTTGGPSWKPLPVAFAALIWPFGEIDSGIPPALWMVVARAGALLALALAARLAWRLTGGGTPSSAGLLAGIVAAGALALTPDWLQFVAHGSEAPLAVALMLWAILRHLDGRRDHALVLGTLACLMRPELFPFLALYALVTWRARPELRGLTAGLMIVLPLAWLVPEWLGSGHPLDGGAQARSEPFWSLSNSDSPWRRALVRFHNHTDTSLELLTLVAVGAALVRRQWAVVVLAGAAAAEVALYLAMTEARFSGNPRYVLPAVTLVCVLAGVGAGALAELAGRALRPLRRPAFAGAAGTAAAAVVIAVWAWPQVDSRVDSMRHEANEVELRMALYRDAARALDEAGGAEAVNRFGPASVNRALHTRLAWELGLPIDDIETARGAGVVFNSSERTLAGRLPVWGRSRGRTFVTREGSFEVYRRQGIPKWIFIRGVAWAFTRSLQGIDIPASRGRLAVTRVITR
jgi:hypothetical protein